MVEGLEVGSVDGDPRRLFVDGEGEFSTPSLQLGVRTATELEAAFQRLPSKRVVRSGV